MVSHPASAPLKRLLYMCEYPPSTAGGAPIIARQFLRRYDADRLHVLCDGRQHRAAMRAGATTLLPCRHTVVGNLELGTLRPRRVFIPIFDILNLSRIPWIERRAREIVEREAIEAIFTIPWRTDFALAAYRVAQRCDLPLYVFETDDWQAMNQGPLTREITRRYQGRILRNAEHLWMISPGMIRRYRERFGVEGDFLFHFVDVDRYQRADPREPAVPGEIRLVYTGAINQMFLGALEPLCTWLNEGVEVDGRRVVLDVWSGSCPEHLQGPAVRYRGFVPSDEVPGILASADLLLMAVTFSQEPALRDLVRTSVYTKSVDYLASGKPIVLVSPSDTAEVQHFGSVMTVVDDLDRGRFESAIGAALGSPDARRRAAEGVALVRRSHTAETMGDRFLAQFRA
jgi:glycosyltransferase involved in cell wall biosynthesis